MTKTLYALLSFVGLICLFSCSETDDTNTEFENWQAKNDAFFEQQYQRAVDSIAVNPTKWKLIKCFSKDKNTEGAHTDYIIVHVLSQRENHDECTTPQYAESPFYTDSVAVHYQGRLLPSTSYTEGYVFDQSNYGNFNPELSRPTKIKLSELIDGFVTAVLNMQRGDRWLVYIPYQLGYGASSSNSAVPSYSTLVFDIALADFY